MHRSFPNPPNAVDVAQAGVQPGGVGKWKRSGLIRSHALDLLAEDARFEMLTTEDRHGLTHGSGSLCSRTTK